MGQDNILTKEQAANRAQVAAKTMCEWLRTGKLKGIKAGHSLRRVRASDLEHFFEEFAKRRYWCPMTIESPN